MTNGLVARSKLKNFRRIVVKVGSSLLIDSAAGEVRAAWLAALAADIAKLHDEGRDVLIVSSGAIALGRSRLRLPRGALKLEESQAARTSPALESIRSDEPTLTTMRRKFFSAGRAMACSWRCGQSVDEMVLHRD